jgi:uncharacterized membrane protein YjgN (DUF898 family)
MNQTDASASPQGSEGGMTASSLISDNTTRPAKSTVAVYPIEFTGSGSEYFRIWIVNLLLMIVTLGLYYPWAKTRRLRYFYGNTVVAGHPLDFHGNPRKMMRGFLLVSLLMFLYSVASRVSPISGAIAFLIMAGVWPALLRSSLQFRLANTSWRGLRFAFNGSLKDAYMVFLVPALGFGLCMALVAGGTYLLQSQFSESAPLLRIWAPLSGVVAFVLGVLAIGPVIWWRLKRYQHANYALGQLQTSFKASLGSMAGVFFKTWLISMGGMLVAGLVVGLALASSGLSLPNGANKEAIGKVFGLAVPVFVGLVVLAQLVQGPYFVSRMQNLIWTETGNRQLRFKSQLKLLPLMWLSLKNWVLVVITLGLYWPFAAVAMARTKLQAISLHSRQDPDLLVAQARRERQDAAGDLAADMIGIDVGL